MCASLLYGYGDSWVFPSISSLLALAFVLISLPINRLFSLRNMQTLKLKSPPGYECFVIGFPPSFCANPQSMEKSWIADFSCISSTLWVLHHQTEFAVAQRNTPFTTPNCKQICKRKAPRSSRGTFPKRPRPSPGGASFLFVSFLNDPQCVWRTAHQANSSSCRCWIMR